MDEKTFINRVKAGELLALGEYRHSKAEMLRWRDKQTLQPKEAPVLRHTVEFNNDTLSVSERVPDGTKLEDIKVSFTKGQMVVLRIEELTRDKGNFSARGGLESFTPSRSNGDSVGGSADPRK